MRSSSRNEARRQGKLAAEMWPLLNLKNPYRNPTLRKVWDASRNRWLFQTEHEIVGWSILKVLRKEDLMIF